MPRQTLVKTAAPGGYAAAAVETIMTAEDVTNHSQFVANGNDLILIQNTDASAHTWTFTSTADPYGRVRDITAQNIPAGKIYVFGPANLAGWVQSDGKIYLQADSALVKFGVIQLPG